MAVQSNQIAAHPSENRLIRVAKYVRMSTDMQQYSIENQSKAITEYADERGFDIVRTYEDGGKSGLKMEGRAGLQALLRDAENGTADFEALLVYDVSRLGRFQDTDEAAFYEMRLRIAGINVHYCAEQFENDGTVTSSIMKAVKRAMAFEYSRELSVKVFAGHANLIRRGYRQGGPAGYALRRILIDAQGQVKTPLNVGEYKSTTTDRVILAPGPANETAIIREIFDLFVNAGKSEIQIASLLNARGIQAYLGRPWTNAQIGYILINEKYIGNNVWGRTSRRLKTRFVRPPASEWIRADGVFPAIVEPTIFARAAKRIYERRQLHTESRLLENLRQLLRKHAFLSSAIINGQPGGPCTSTYRNHFGSLLKAYELVGFRTSRDHRFLANARNLEAAGASTLRALMTGVEAVGGIVAVDEANLVTVNHEITIRILVARCYRTEAGSSRWRIKLRAHSNPDVFVIVRMDRQNDDLLDYYIIPSIDLVGPSLNLYRDNVAQIDTYRFHSLEPIFRMATRSPARINV